jgi:hypothetical protein
MIAAGSSESLKPPVARIVPSRNLAEWILVHVHALNLAHALRQYGSNEDALELGKPAWHGQNQSPCGGVVYARALPSERDRAPLAAIAASMPRGLPFDRASRPRRFGDALQNPQTDPGLTTEGARKKPPRPPPLTNTPPAPSPIPPACARG